MQNPHILFGCEVGSPANLAKSLNSGPGMERRDRDKGFVFRRVSVLWRTHLCTESFHHSIIQTNGTVPPLVDLMISCINCQVEQLETVNKLQMPWSKQSMPWIGGTSPIFGWGNKYFFDSNYPICFHEITEYHISPRISFFQVSSPFLVLKPSFFAGQRCHFLTNPPSFDLSFVAGGTETPCRRWSPHPRHAGAIEYLSFIPPPLFFWWKWGGVPLESLFWDVFGQFMYHCL